MLFWGVFIALSCGVYAATWVDLVARVQYSLFDANGAGSGNWLADGSVVYIIGSGDSVADPMQPWGTNYLADSVTGDDVFVGMVTIGSGSSSNGTFATADYQFDADEVNYLYIRFFDSVDQPPVGQVDWGQSPTFVADDQGYGLLILDFQGNYSTTNTSNFAVVPEPGTAPMFLLLGVMAFAFRMAAARNPDEPRSLEELKS